MTIVHLFRHGETIWHSENRYAGSSDVALTPLGWEQAARLARWAQTTRIDLVATSDLSRSLDTGRMAAEAVGLEPVIDARLREVDFGDGEGKTRQEMSAAFPAGLESFLRAPASSPLPGGEPGERAVGRGLSALASLTSAVPDEAIVVVVAHTTMIRLMLCRMLGLPLDDYRRRFPELGNVTATTVRLPRATAAAELCGAGQLLRYNTPV